jgi:hypothetical protein
VKTDKTPGHIKLDEKTAASDGGRLELKTHESAKPVLFAAQESPDDMSDSGGGIRKRTRTLRYPDRKIRDWNDFVRLGGTSVLDSDPIICSLATELVARNTGFYYLS